MFIDITTVTIYVRPGITDMRKAINGLSVIASEEMEKDPLSGSLFLFCNRYRRILKCLYWDRNGFCLWQKRLERDRFPWPMSEEAAREISGEQLKMLLSGIDCKRSGRNQIAAIARSRSVWTARRHGAVRTDRPDSRFEFRSRSAF